jgi:hypothetical protein
VRFEVVPVPFLGDALGSWIEAHEVTRAEYDQFRAARARRRVRTPARAPHRPSAPAARLSHRIQAPRAGALL